jgi:hypothetical protein
VPHEKKKVGPGSEAKWHQCFLVFFGWETAQRRGPKNSTTTSTSSVCMALGCQKPGPEKGAG